MTKYLLVMFLAFIGCVKKNADTNANRPTSVDGSVLKRYETEEVICFTIYSNGIWCHLKGSL